MFSFWTPSTHAGLRRLPLSYLCEGFWQGLTRCITRLKRHEWIFWFNLANSSFDVVYSLCQDIDGVIQNSKEVRRFAQSSCKSRVAFADFTFISVLCYSKGRVNGAFSCGWACWGIWQDYRTVTKVPQLLHRHHNQSSPNLPISPWPFLSS